MTTFLLRAVQCVAIVAITPSPVNAQWPVPYSTFGPARYIRIAQMNGQVPSNGDYINLALVSVFDCNYGWLRPRAATLSSTYSSAYVAANCINNGTSFCHTRAGGGDQWLQIDMGTTVNIGMIKVFNRADCCKDRIEHYNIALFNGANGVGRVSEIMSFYGVQNVYTFNLDSTPYAGGGCQNIQHPTTVSSVAALAANISAQVSTLNTEVTAIPASQLTILQDELARLNTSQISLLATEIDALSSQVAAEQSTVTGGILQTLTATTDTGNAVSTIVSSMADTLPAVSSIADMTNANFVALRDAITGAANANSGTGSASVPPAITTDGTNLNVVSGQCQSNNFCDSSSFAANLKQAIRSL